LVTIGAPAAALDRINTQADTVKEVVEGSTVQVLDAAPVPMALLDKLTAELKMPVVTETEPEPFCGESVAVCPPGT